MRKKPGPYTTTSTRSRSGLRPERRSGLLAAKEGKGEGSMTTEFQKAVYRVLRQIPRGETRTYKWVAKKIGRPRAFRAVGNALNKNPYPGIIPCHRVIKSDGTIGGFSKGASAKKRLLSAEGIMV